jgi:hypothetical protein
MKSLKYHSKRTVSKTLLNFEECSTFITEIEVFLNSRLLTALAYDPNDASYFSPGHFLIGTLLTSLLVPDFTNAIMNSLSRWQRVQRFNQQLWKTWSSDNITAYSNAVNDATSNQISSPVCLSYFMKTTYLSCRGN